MVKVGTKKMGFEKIVIWGLVIFVGWKIYQEWQKTQSTNLVEVVPDIVTVENVEGTETKRVSSGGRMSGLSRLCCCKSHGQSWSYSPAGNETAIPG